jgi:hypothetical protein
LPTFRTSLQSRPIIARELDNHFCATYDALKPRRI